MGARTGLALRLVQWFIRAIEFCCAALILALFSYFLATLRSHKLRVPTWVRAVEGISGAATLYTILGLLFLCCVAGHPILSPIMLFLDILFLGAFIYLASANRDGASSCNGIVNTPYGRGNSTTSLVDNGRGGIEAPDFHRACKMQTACLAVAIVGIIFFLLSALFELALMRHRRREKRYGPSPINGYTSGYGKTKQGGFFSRFGSKKHTNTGHISDNPNALPEHTTPGDLHRNSYGTEQTWVDNSHPGPDALPPSHNQPMSGVNTGYGSYGAYKPDPATTRLPHESNPYTHHTEFANTGGNTGTNGLNNPSTTATTHYPPGNYRYDDGVYDRT